MEQNSTIIFSLFYGFSIIYLALSVLNASACHPPEYVNRARIRFVVSFGLFLVTTVLMMFYISIWFGVPFVIILSPFVIGNSIAEYFSNRESKKDSD